MNSFFYGVCIFTTVLYFFGVLKRQHLFIKYRVKFDIWHGVFCLTTIPMIMSVIPFIDLSSGRIYTLWIVPLSFHVCNMIDLQTHFNKEQN